MTFLELSQTRRSIRKYTTEPVSDEAVQQILQAALMSPASKRCNPWEFVVVRRREVLNQLADCRTYGSTMLQEAAVAIVVCVDPSLTDTWQCDGAIAAHQMLLEAADIGLGACWVQVFGRAAKSEGTGSAEDLVKTLCQIPDNMNVLCIISIGHKNEERKPRDLEKLQYEKIHIEHYK
ncbi:MAG: nitroreductase family protein [Paludibacteraceae bacterium]|nr:nitroreductase family protein [Paludibacteraceae bacterium]